MLSIFACFFGLLYVFFGEISVWICFLFFFWFVLDWVFCFLILCCMGCLYILEINPLSVASFANIFSHSEGCFFILFMDSFAVQKLLSLIRSHLFIFVFIFITLGGGSKKILLWFMSKSVPIFSPKSFIVSGLTFRSLIHFEFIFVYDVREYSDSCSFKKFLFIFNWRIIAL